jgi:hypothetical protein
LWIGSVQEFRGSEVQKFGFTGFRGSGVRVQEFGFKSSGSRVQVQEFRSSRVLVQWFRGSASAASRAVTFELVNPNL